MAFSIVTLSEDVLPSVVAAAEYHDLCVTMRSVQAKSKLQHMLGARAPLLPAGAAGADPAPASCPCAVAGELVPGADVGLV